MKNTVKTRIYPLIENTKVGMIALGCEKNRIDAEVMLAMLENAGCELCADESECDVIIVHLRFFFFFNEKDTCKHVHEK